jgi:hypothetical protein
LDFTKKNIWVLTDGSQGMVSQVMGLAQQFSANILPIKTKLLFPWSKLQPGILPIFSWIFLNNLNFSFPPDIIVSCGRKSVYLSIYLKKKFKNIITIHIQNPKINFQNFNFIIAPEHDHIKGNNVITSIGALHKFTKNTIEEHMGSSFNIPKKKLISVLIGGNNNHYKFSVKEINKLSLEIQNLKKSYPEYSFLILSSRRTTREMKKILKHNLEKIAIIWNENEKNPYTFSLKNSDFFIITSDSTSMISECAFTGHPIFIFHLPFKRQSKRMEKFHEKFQQLNITKKLDYKNDLIPWTYNSLNESKRIASIVKERIIKEN